MFFHLLGLNNIIFYLLEFIVAAAIILFAGKRLTIYGDKIATGSIFSHGWIGFILMAAITSIPELMTGISATAIVGSVDLMVSDTIGSNAVNIVILALMFLFAGKKLFQIKLEELISCYGGLFLATVVGIFILANMQNLVTSIWVSIAFSVVLFLLYIAVVVITFKTGGLKDEGETIEKSTEKYIGLKFTFFAALIIVASVWMTQTADFMASTPVNIGSTSFVLGETLVGALLLSIATSLPELSVTINCVLIGNLSMAVGNIFGSNIFNIFIIPLSSIFYRGNLWQDVNYNNIYLVFLVFLVTNIMAMDLITRTRLKKKGTSIMNIATLLLWICGMVVVFLQK